MSNANSEGNRIRGTGVLEALIASAIVWASKELTVAGWPHFAHRQAPDWAKSEASSLILALPLFGVVFFWRALRFRFATRGKRKTPPAGGHRLSIYVAHLAGDDPSETCWRSVMDSIRDELGPDRVEVLPAGIQLSLTEGVGMDQEAIDATRRGRALLVKHGGDLLIWGRVHAIAEKRVIELRFVSAAQDGSEGQRFRLGKKFLLDDRFAPEMTSALAAVAVSLARPAVQYQGRFVTEILPPVATKLDPLVRNLPETIRPADRARLLYSYGLIQDAIGDQSGESAPLRSAVAAFREALKEYTRERVPLDWAATQDILGNALRILGERESGTERLDEAVAAYREALKERTHERVPQDWATTQNNLGTALMRIGERENGTKRLEQAATAFREALKERTRERVPLDWATTQNNLGNAIMKIGERESGTERFEQAVIAYREALKERTRERVPLDWATTQNNLGAALTSLGERENRTERFEQAVSAYGEALKERTREHVPLDWATTQNNLGNVLTRIGQRENGTERLDQAVVAYREALSVLRDDVAPYFQSIALKGLAHTEKLLQERRNSSGGD